MAFYEVPLREKFGADTITVEEFRGNRRFVVPAEKAHAVLTSFHDGSSDSTCSATSRESIT